MFFKKLKPYIRDYFTLTSRERKGALVLACIILLQMIILVWLHYLPSDNDVEISKYSMQLASFDEKMKDQKINTSFSSNKVFENNNSKNPNLHLYPFNPNTITNQQWMDFGLSEKQVNVIRNYLIKGGRFRNKEGVSKMYCITPELFQQLEPYIEIPADTIVDTAMAKNNRFSTPAKIGLIELNSADTLVLIQLPQVGAGRARMIYRYRERLGGFVKMEQLLEVFTIDSTVLAQMLPYCKLDLKNIRKINVNSDSLSHPYLTKQVIKALVAYRTQHGNFNDINGLRQVTVIDDQILSKLVPYLSFE